MKHLIPLALPYLTLTCCAFASPATDNWIDLCAKCHGGRGKGDTFAGAKLRVRDFTDTGVQSAVTDEQMAKSIVEGLIVDGKGKMRPYTELSTDQVKELVAHMRKFKNSSARAQPSGQTPPKST